MKREKIIDHILLIIGATIAIGEAFVGILYIWGKENPVLLCNLASTGGIVFCLVLIAAFVNSVILED